MKISLMLALFFILHAVALAQDASCSKITNDLDRLVCYDKASGRIPTATIEPAPSGKWQITTEKSKLTDRTSVFLSVQSNETVDCGWNNGDKLSLYIRCHENQTDLLFVTQCHMTSSDYNSYGQIDYRIDADKAQKVEAKESTDNKSLGLWGGTKSIPMIKQMIGKHTLITQMTPYGENPFNATFDISGLDQAISQLRKECGW